MPRAWDTLIYVPSIALGPLTRRYLIGLDYFQERNYYFARALGDQKKQIVFVLSEEIQDDLLHAHVELLRRIFSIPADPVTNLHVLKVEQRPGVSLSAALLGDAAGISKLRSLIHGRNSGLDFWTIGPDEIALANALSLPHIGMPAKLAGADGKADAKRIFKQVGARTPQDFGVFFDIKSIWRHLKANGFPSAGTLLLKLNHEEGGNGIARLRLDAGFETRESLRTAITVDKPYIDFSEFEEEMSAQGALVEIFLADDIIASPSAKMWIDEDGNVSCLATHDQILRDSMYLGCRFPADSSYRKQVRQTALVIGRECAQEGWRGIVSVDFLVTSSPDDARETELWAIEINARKCATTHPYFWTRTLTGAALDAENDMLHVDGRPLVYQSAEYVASPLLAEISGESVLRMIEDAGLGYDPQSKEGVLVHMLSCARAHRKIGVTAISAHHHTADGYIRAVQRLITAPGHVVESNSIPPICEART